MLVGGQLSEFLCENLCVGIVGGQQEFFLKRDYPRLGAVFVDKAVHLPGFDQQAVVFAQAVGFKIQMLHHFAPFHPYPGVVVEAVTGLDLYMKQIFEHGFFHADPHPGNILLTDGGKLAFIDLGAMGTLLPPERELLSDCLVYASQKNVKKLIAALKNLAVSYRVEDEKTLERQLGEILETVGGSSLNGLDVGDLMQRFTRILSQNSIAMPEGVYLLAKGIAQIEGIGRHLHPELDIAAVLRPYVTDIIKRKLSPKRLISEGFGRLSDSYDSFLALPEELKNFLHKISNKEIRLEHELHRLDDIRNSFERVGLMLIIAALIIAASVLSLNDKPPQLYGFPLPSLICFAIAALLALWLALKRK